MDPIAIITSLNVVDSIIIIVGTFAGLFAAYWLKKRYWGGSGYE